MKLITGLGRRPRRDLLKLHLFAFIMTAFFGTAFGLSPELFACGMEKADAKARGPDLVPEARLAGSGQKMDRSPASHLNLGNLGTPDLTSALTQSGSEPAWQIDRHAPPPPSEASEMLKDKITSSQSTEGIAPAIRGTYYNH